MKFELRTIVSYLLLGIVLFSLFIGIHSVYFAKAPTQVALENAKNKAVEREVFFADWLEHAAGHIHALSVSEALNQYLLQGEADSQRILEDMMLSHLRSSDNLMQLRVLNDQGKELIRFERTQPGTLIFKTQPQKLQDKSQRDYFKRALSDASGQILYSKIDLNREFGQIQKPHNPVIRLMIKVSAHGQTVVIVANYFMKQILDKLFDAPLYHMALVDKQGHIVYHSQPELRWSESLQGKRLFDLANFKDTQALFESQRDHLNPESFYIHWLDLPVEQQLALIFQINPQFQHEQGIAQTQLYIAIGSLIFLLMLIMSFYSSRLIFKGRTLESIKELEQVYNATFNLSSFGFAHVNKDGEILRVNAKLTELTGYDASSLQGQRLMDFVALEWHKDCELNPQDEASFQEHQFYKIECLDGSRLSVHHKASSIYKSDSDTFLFYLVLIEDVSELERLEQTLIREKQKAEKASEAKSLFLSNMSHEVRTPLNGVIGLTEQVLNSTLTQKQRENLEKSQQSAQSLLNILNDIIDFTQMEAKTFELNVQRFSIENLVKQVLYSFHYETSFKNNEVSLFFPVEIDDQVIGDVTRLRQVLMNLISNANKFTEGGDINLSIVNKEETQNHLTLEFSVCDTGIGIPPEKMTSVLEGFEQVDNSHTRSFGGIGLGLPICQKIVQSMGGELRISSNSQQVGEEVFESGTCVSFTLTFKKSITMLSLLNPDELKRSRLAYVNDEKGQNKRLRDIFDSWGVKADVFKSMSAMIKAVRHQPKYDYVVVNFSTTELTNYLHLQTLASYVQHIVVISGLHDANIVYQKIKKLELRSFKVVSMPITASKILESLTLNLPTPNATLSDTPLDETDEIGERDKTDETTEYEYSQTSPPRYRVLLVEDNEINQLVLEDQLKQLGCLVDIAQNGLEGLTYAQANTYDMIFMDLQMPVMNGFESAQQIRKFDRDTPIVAVSAAVMPQDVKKTRECGMNDHIAKPATKEDLKLALATYKKATSQ